MVEGKLSIWIKDGSFSHASDLYIQLMVDDNKIWKTDEKDGFSPDFDSTVTKHIKGDYEKLIIKLMDEDTFSRDDVLATAEFDMPTICSEGLNDSIELCNADGESVGTLNVNINFEEGDVGMFDLLGSMLHKDD